MSVPAVPEVERPSLVRLSDLARRFNVEGMELRRKYARDGAFLRLRVYDIDTAHALKRCANELGFEVTLNGDTAARLTEKGRCFQLVIVIPNADLIAADRFRAQTVPSIENTPRELTSG